jgi:hypothetical protein
VLPLGPQDVAAKRIERRTVRRDTTEEASA